MRIKANTDNPLHANFYFIKILNGGSGDIHTNFDNLRRSLFF